MRFFRFLITSLLVCAIPSSTRNTAVAATITGSISELLFASGIGQPIGHADGADFAGSDVIYTVEIGPDTYGVFSGFWASFGSSAGGFTVPAFTISLNGDSYSSPFQITNTGTTHLLSVDILAESIGSPIINPTPPNAVFDTSLALASGFTSDLTAGTAVYSAPGYLPPVPTGFPLPPTPFFLSMSIGFDKPGLFARCHGDGLRRCRCHRA